MNIEQLFRESINEIKSKWELPKSGFLSGGSIANLVWEKKSGNKAIINDLDIYYLDGILEKYEEEEFRKKQSYRKQEKVVFEDYSGLNINFKSSSYYIIEKVDTVDILNNIYYRSNTSDPFIIIDSFDINCCQAGYDIATDKFYWTKEFEDFLNTGEVRLVSLNSPAHSAMRLVKKKIDLNAKLPDIELDIIAYSLINHCFIDTIKHRFKKRYAKMFEVYQSELDSRFDLVRDLELEQHLMNTKNISDFFWTLKPKVNGLEIDSTQKVGVNHSKDFLFWVRQIFGNEELEKIWYNIHLIIDYTIGFENYLDCKPTQEQLELLNRLISNAPDSVKHLLGFTLSKQLSIIETLLDKFKSDPIIAISILETYKIENINIEDDMELLLLELAVRKKILDDSRGKVNKIIYTKTNNSNLVRINNIDNLPF